MLLTFDWQLSDGRKIPLAVAMERVNGRNLVTAMTANETILDDEALDYILMHTGFRRRLAAEILMEEVCEKLI